MNVLVTGFGPFLGHRVNPSDAIARRLDGRRFSGVSWVACSPLPVVFAEAASVALEAAARAGADAICALGLAATESVIRVERCARNAATAASPDARGTLREGELTRLGGPDRLETSVDTRAIVEALQRAGIQARSSDDAGGYVCNDLYYRLLDAASSAGPSHHVAPSRVVFIHVPPGSDGEPGLVEGLGRVLSEILSR